jgi:signal transduction histidine kinase
VGRLELYPFSEDDLDLLELIADRLSIAIDNAQLYNELLQNIDSLEFERGMREQFVNTLSHDLRNPLTAAKMSAQIITRTPDLQRASDLAFRVMNSLNRADRMIQDLLDANRIRAGHPLPLELSDCDVVQLTSEVIDEFTSMHGRRFKLKAPAELKAFVSCNEIVRLLENLIGNAIKYGAEKEIEVSLEKLPENLFQICVHNWGNPISVEKQQKLFKPFSRTPEAEAGGKKGWGLGLTLVRGVAEAHGGKVKVESSKSEGTTFTVILPLNAQQ